MRKTEIRFEIPESFFDRGRKLAKRADRGERIPESRVIAFDGVESLLLVVVENQLAGGNNNRS